MTITKLPYILAMAWLLPFMAFFNLASSVRTLPNHHNKLTFLMQDVLNRTSSRSVTSKSRGPLPFSKPLGLFPPTGGIPIPETTLPTSPVAGLSSQTLDLSSFRLPYPAMATLQDLEFGTVTTIEEDMFETMMSGSQIVGKAQGVYVASSEDGISHMLAMTTFFADNKFEDSLRFFGVHRTDADVSESHIAVIGGSGKYRGANGFAAVKTVAAVGSDSAGDDQERRGSKLLLFNVYLS